MIPSLSETHGAKYEICISSWLDECWSEMFDGMTITNLEDGRALISGAVVDQSALLGLLDRIRDLNLNIIYVKTVTQNCQDAAAPEG